MLKPGVDLAGKDYSVDFTILDISGYEPPRVPSMTWKELIKKVWEIDFLTCPRCGSVVIGGLFHYVFFAISRVLPTVPRMRLSRIFWT